MRSLLYKALSVLLVIVKIAVVVVLLLMALYIGMKNAGASPGGTDSDGCHVCWTRCDEYGLQYGERHCHAKPPAPKKKPSAAAVGAAIAVPALLGFAALSMNRRKNS